MWRGVVSWACVVGAALGGEGQAIRLRGFEPEEMKGFGKPGRPIGTRSPEPGFRAEPPDPAVFWDQHTPDPRRSTWLRFARIPNP